MLIRMLAMTPESYYSDMSQMFLTTTITQVSFTVKPLMNLYLVMPQVMFVALFRLIAVYLSERQALLSQAGRLIPHLILIQLVL